MVQPPTHLGDFEIVRELGRGGMGVVYEAVQTSLGRRVALKLLGPGLGLTPRAVDRLRREAAAAARLHHTNIVPVYATGEQDGVHFYAMELIDGPSLDAVIRQQRSQSRQPGAAVAPDLAATGAYTPPDPLSTPSPSSTSGGSSADRFDRIAAMIADVAEALHHAHQNGVTHRDVKPSNLMLSSDGRLSVTDFGLARMLEQPGMTVTGEFVGTPAYMSPEQVTAGRVAVDHRTDIYSLGATLYELLTLRPPFVADGRDKLLAMVLQKEPAPPRSVDAKVPRDLETICLKCLEKDPDRRYQTGKELADDLRRFVNRFAILARRAGPLTRVKKWVRRNPALAAAGLAVIAALGTAGFFAWKADEAERQRLADEQMREAELRAERRQAAVEKAILEAMSGDAPAALAAITDAEAKGADAGTLNMLRAVVEVHRGREKEALVYLEQADRQLPDSVAVKALLATAYLYSGDWTRYDEFIVLAEGLKPQTPEDVIFLAQAQGDVDPARGLQTLNNAPVRARQSSVAMLVRAQIQVRAAQFSGRRADAEQALRDLDRVELGDNPVVPALQMEALLTAAHAARTDQSAHDAFLKQAAEIDRRLARLPDEPAAVKGRLCYLYVAGDEDALLKFVRDNRAHFKTVGVAADDFLILYRRKRFAEALESVRADPWPDRHAWLSVQALLCATLGRRDEAERLFSQAMQTMRTRSGIYLVVDLPFMRVLGPGRQIDPNRIARDALEHSARSIPDWRGGWYRALCRFNAGELDADQLLAKAGDYAANQCEAYFHIGMYRLGEGKRAEAKRCFEKACDTGVYNFGEYMWSRAFLGCIDDPEWLPWLAEKK